MRRRLRLWTACAVVGARLACSAAPAAGQAVSGDNVYRMPLEVDAKTLDPAGIDDAYSWCIARRIFSTLVRHDPRMRLQPELAEKWTVSADGLTYTFSLRRGVRFHHGPEMVADDVAYSLARVAKKRYWIVEQIVGSREVAEGRAALLSGVTTPDPHTVRIRLAAPFPPFIQQMAMVNAAVVPRDVVEPDEPAFGRRPVGTGPFRLVEWSPKHRVVLARFDGYFRGPAKLESIQIRFLREVTVAYEAYLGGELDHCVVPLECLRREMTGPRKGDIRVVPNLNVRYLGITMGRGPLGDNVHLRRALNYAVDREFLCGKLLGGSETPAKGPLPPGVPGYDPDMPGYSYDRGKALAELQAAGYSRQNPPPPMTLWYTSLRNGQQVAEQVQADARKIGVTLRLRTVDFAALLAATEQGEPDLFRLTWVADYPDPDNFLYVLFHSRQRPLEGNRSHFADRDVDLLLDAARAEPDADRRLALYRRAERAIVDKAPWVFLSHGTTYLLVSPRVRDLELGPLDEGTAMNGADFHRVRLAPGARP